MQATFFGILEFFFSAGGYTPFDTPCCCCCCCQKCAERYLNLQHEKSAKHDTTATRISSNIYTSIQHITCETLHTTVVELIAHLVRGDCVKSTLFGSIGTETIWIRGCLWLSTLEFWDNLDIGLFRVNPFEGNYLGRMRFNVPVQASVLAGKFCLPCQDSCSERAGRRPAGRGVIKGSSTIGTKYACFEERVPSEFQLDFSGPRVFLRCISIIVRTVCSDFQEEGVQLSSTQPSALILVYAALSKKKYNLTRSPFVVMLCYTNIIVQYL